MTRRGGRGDGDAPPPGRPRAIPENIAAAQEALAGSAQRGRPGGASDATSAAAQPTLVTQATGQPGGTPGGRPTRIGRDEDDSVRRSLEMENSGAATLAGRGYRIQQNPAPAEVDRARREAGDTGDPESNPDYLLEGRVFDCYSPTKPTKNVRGIWTEVEEKINDGQTQRVVVNLESWRGDVSALQKQFLDWPISGLKEVKIITADGDIVQVPLRTDGEHG